MGELVTGLDIGRDGLRRAVDRVAGCEEGALDAVALQQGYESRDDDDVVFAALDRGRRGHAAGDEARKMVVVEGEADDVARHGGGSGEGSERDRRSLGRIVVRAHRLMLS